MIPIGERTLDWIGKWRKTVNPAWSHPRSARIASRQTRRKPLLTCAWCVYLNTRLDAQHRNPSSGLGNDLERSDRAQHIAGFAGQMGDH